jgi:type II secretory ATPase GspE/PulE/Tfp pilus assembly ATPase PilB-like protein
MRRRVVVGLLLFCLSTAWPALPIGHAQEENPLNDVGQPAAAQPEAPAEEPPAEPTPPPEERETPPVEEPPAAVEEPPVEEPPAADEPAAPGEEQAVAEEAAPAPAPAGPTDKWNDAHSIFRLSNPSISWPKLLLIGSIFLIWVKSADWVNRDAQIYGFSYGTWNPIMFFPFFALLLLFALPMFIGVPFFLVAVILLPICYLATFVPYVVMRNRAVALHQKVFTPDWFRFVFAQLVGKVGIKIDAERKAEYEKGAPVELMAIGAAEERDNQANLIGARQSSGYLLVKELVADMITRRSDRVMLDYTQQSVVARHHVDGVWHNGEARDRESGDIMLAVMKTLANLDAAERRKKQEGKFGGKYEKHSYIFPLTAQGVKTGERVVVQLLGGFQHSFKKYEDLGMRSKLAEQWSALMARDKGMLIIAGMPEGGITTLTDASLMETDRLLRDFASIEEERHREREIENIEVTTYNAAAGETPVSVIPRLIRKYPNVYVLRDLSDTEAAKLLFGEVRDEERLLITNAAAKDAAEALLRMLQMKVPQRDFAAVVTAVLCTRLIRKLCNTCKVGYAPTPDLLKKLGIPQGKVEALFRAPKPEEIDKPCPNCGGIGFKGRTGMFELIEVNEPIREILVKQPQLDLLRKAARAANMRSFQEEGLLLVAKGVTSLAELQRILKE